MMLEEAEAEGEETAGGGWWEAVVAAGAEAWRQAVHGCTDCTQSRTASSLRSGERPGGIVEDAEEDEKIQRDLLRRIDEAQALEQQKQTTEFIIGGSSEFMTAAFSCSSSSSCSSIFDQSLHPADNKSLQKAAIVVPPHHRMGCCCRNWHCRC